MLRTLVFSQKQVAAEGGRWFEVRVLPYRTVDNRIDGVVMTFVDITQDEDARGRAPPGGVGRRGPDPDAGPDGAIR